MDPDLILELESGATLVTPNRRLARDLTRRFDSTQARAGRAAWRSADILPWGAWLERALADCARHDPRLRLLSPAQELALWQRLIEASRARDPLLDTAAAARSAREAHQLQLAWRIDLARAPTALSEDTLAYLGWASAFDDACHAGGWLAPARAADALAQRAPAAAARLPRKLILYGFDRPSTQQNQLLEALRAASVRVEVRAVATVAATVQRAAYLSAEEEWAAVAGSVRQLLDAGAGQRIGVVVSGLAAHRAGVLRVFDQALDPGRVLPGASRRAPACNVSLGVSLASFPLVQAALTVLRLAQGQLPLTEAGMLLRSPFLASAEHEFLRRALLDAQLRRRGRLEIDPEALLEMARGRAADDAYACRQLALRLEVWLPRAAQARVLRQLPSDWSATFAALLAGLGWPGERTLDSDEYQTYAKWRELVSGLAHLDPVLGRLRYGEAWSWLARVAADTLFQPESDAVAVQILGTLESVGLQFDHLFVTGLHDEAWPEPARPNPFLPVALQRSHGVPHSSAEWELDFARRMTAGWRSAAAQVTLSHPARDGERVLRASPLLDDLHAAPAPAAAPWGYAAQIRLAARLELVSDGVAPPLPAGFEAPGGAGVFQNQAACPFRAFAVHRLGAHALEEGHLGLDARERGTLLHRALALLWGELQSQERLLALGDDALRAAVSGATDMALAWMRGRRPDALSPAFANLERDRLRRLLSESLELERRRAPFHVLAREEPRTIEVGALRVQGRVDRIDALADGRRVILDYKSGRASTSEWLGPRPDAPQVPLYAITDPGEIAAVAFVQLRPDENTFKGFAAARDLLPGAVAPPREWPGLLAQWRENLEALAAEFLVGHVPVAPKRYPHTCQYCRLGPLCRVQELFDRGPVSDEDIDNG